jgi:predicted Rossmann fold flavoprotein
MKVAVAGGGAAGFFAAVTAAEHHPGSGVTIFEKSDDVLSKVLISGGGRCNVTNGCETIEGLCAGYPRGANFLRKTFREFSNLDAMEWFRSRGVPLVVQSDGCVFPASQNSRDIVDCFLREAWKLKVDIRTGTPVKGISSKEGSPVLELGGTEDREEAFDRVIAATGGARKQADLQWLRKLGHDISEPVPSLFTFNMPKEPITGLMGVVVENASIAIQGTRLRAEGPLLITHWGMSGPAVLKLSSLGARLLHGMNYDFRVSVNWVNIVNNSEVLNGLEKVRSLHSARMLMNYRPLALPERLWQFLLERSGLPGDRKWGELGRNGMNRLTSILTNDVYPVKGRTSFREEFVTCGGVGLKGVDPKTMGSRVFKNLYLAGEVLDIDGLTGGYNFQAAWTTGFIAGLLRN